MRKCSYLLFVVSIVAVLQACTPVKPWERGNLARPEMALVVDSMEATVQSHVYHSKEGSSAVAAGSGGGCGCN